MTDILIDVTGDEGAIALDTPQGFDLRLTIAGVALEMTNDQAKAVHAQLQGFFGPEPGEDASNDAARWRFFADSPQTALMLGSRRNPNAAGVDWTAESDRLADAAMNGGEANG